MVCFVRYVGMKHQEIRHIVIAVILQELQLLNASPCGCGPGAFIKRTGAPSCPVAAAKPASHEGLLPSLCIGLLVLAASSR